MQITTHKEFLSSEAGAQTKIELQRMADSGYYATPDAYDTTTGRKQPFVDRHINYLVKHPGIVPETYLSNLRVMTKNR